MKPYSLQSLAVAALALVASTSVYAQSASYVVDAVHSGATFKVERTGLSWSFGRFNVLSGEFTTGQDASFTLIAKTDSIDTGNAQRDQHLKSPDFFNARQFPEVTFKSTAIKPIDDGYEVIGNLTLHGVTKQVTVVLKGGKPAEFPQGTPRTGFTGELVIKRSDFGVGQTGGPIADEVYVTWSFEGTKK